WAIQSRRMAISRGERCLPLFGGGMTPAPLRVMRSSTALSSGLPGARTSRAPAGGSRRRRALREDLAGPWRGEAVAGGVVAGGGVEVDGGGAGEGRAGQEQRSEQGRSHGGAVVGQGGHRVHRTAVGAADNGRTWPAGAAV